MKNNRIYTLSLAVFSLIVLIASPIYVPICLCWEHRGEIKDFYVQCFRAITFQEI